MGDILVVGVHSDADIEKNKGPTVMKEQERLIFDKHNSYSKLTLF